MRAIDVTIASYGLKTALHFCKHCNRRRWFTWFQGVWICEGCGHKYEGE